jgi:hypothetical protein
LQRLSPLKKHNPHSHHHITPFSVGHIHKNNNIAAILTNTEDGYQLFPNPKIADDYTK